MMTLYRILTGALLLCYGRKLFWLFVGVLGFAIASEVTAELLKGEPALVQLLISVAVGFVGIIIAITIQEIAIALAGFMAGGYFLTLLIETWGLQFHYHSWIIFLVGGIIGALLMVWMFDWALIVLSSATGANLIIQSFRMNSAMASAVFIVLFVLGIVIQARLTKPRLRRGRTGA